MMQGLADITLRKTTMSTGYQVQSVTTTKTVMARMGTATRSEYYAAASVGIKADAACTIRACEYDGEDEAIYDGITYTIVRAYARSPHTVELTLSRR